MKEKYSHDRYIELMLSKENKQERPEKKYKEMFIPDLLYKPELFTEA
jgi:hypothetical protein